MTRGSGFLRNKKVSPGSPPAEEAKEPAEPAEPASPVSDPESPSTRTEKIQREQIVCSLQEGEYFGDVALLTYEARTASGQLLDRGVQTQYTVGDQQFIPGWDLCVRSLAVGERASFAVSSDYAYGIQGVPPAVLANESLTFDVTALEYRGNIQTSASFASDAPLTPRTPGSIKAEFERRQAEKAVRASSDRALRDERDAEASPLDQVKNAFGDLGDKFFGDEGFYFFGFFESATGEEAPWYLKPYLTFPAIFLGVALSFYGLLQTDVIVLRGDNSPIPGQQGFTLSD